MIIEKFDMDRVRELVDQGLLKCSTQGELTVYNYTGKTEWEKLWDDYTKSLRGTVLDSQGNVIARAIPKFFHVFETEESKLENLPTDGPCDIFQKVDGSCMLLFWNPFEERWQFSSKCSFTSDYVKAAERLLDLSQISVSKNYTYVMELRFDEDPMRRVVDIPQGLYLITAIHNTQGWEILDVPIEGNELETVAEIIGIKCVKRIPGTFMEHWNSFKTLEGTEGHVARFANGQRVKLKTPWYITRNRCLDEINTPSRAKAFMLDNMLKLPKEHWYLGIPPEYVNECREVLENIITDKEGIDLFVSQTIEEHKNLSDKDFALAISKYAKVLQSCCFLARRGRDYDSVVWKNMLSE